MSAEEGPEGNGVVSRAATGSVSEVLNRLITTLSARGVKVFAIIDHSGEAAGVGQALRDTKLVVFGNPEGGTPLMRAAPLVALDLPLKILVWQQADGQTVVTYNTPSYLAERYGLTDDGLRVLSAVSTLADAILQPDLDEQQGA